MRREGPSAKSPSMTIAAAACSASGLNWFRNTSKNFVAYVPESRIGAVAARTVSKWMVMQLRKAVMNRRSESLGWRGMNYGAYEGGTASGNDFDPFVVYIDEFAKFAAIRDFEPLLAEARKQHVAFVLSTQTLSQTKTYDVKSDRASHLEDAVLGNVASTICYPVGAKDAAIMSRQFDVDEERRTASSDIGPWRGSAPTTRLEGLACWKLACAIRPTTPARRDS